MSDPWYAGPLVGFDTETTGINPLTARPVSFAFVLHTPQDVFRIDHQLVNPRIPIPPATTAIHGITDDQVADAMPVEEAVTYCVDKILRLSGEGIPIVGMNLAYDLTILNTLSMGRLEGWAGPCLDVMVLDKAVDKWRKGGRKLSDLVRAYDITTPGEAHDATYDATASVLIVRAMAERFKRVRFQTPASLHTQQITWRAEQQADLSAYFVDRGKPPIDTREMGWPTFTTT